MLIGVLKADGNRDMECLPLTLRRCITYVKYCRADQLEAKATDKATAVMIRCILVVPFIFIPFNNGAADKINDISEY